MTSVLCLILVTLLFHHHQTTATDPPPDSTRTTVLASQPISPVEQGLVLAVHFLIDNFQPGHIVIISRQTSTHQLQTLTWNGDILAGVHDDVFVAVRPASAGDNSIEYLLTIKDVKLDEAGEYFCQVLSSPGNEVASDSIRIGVQYFPPQSPTCVGPVKVGGALSGVSVYAGVKLTLNCISVKGHPPVVIQWKTTGGDGMTTAPTMFKDVVIQESDDNIQAMLEWMPRLEHSGVIFTCQIQSVAFPGQVRQCVIGPLSVLPMPKDITTTTTGAGETFTNGTLPVMFHTPPQSVTKEQTTNQVKKCQTAAGSKKTSGFWRTITLFQVKLFWVVAVFVSLVASAILIVVDSALLSQLRRLEKAAVLQSPDYISPRDAISPSGGGGGGGEGVYYEFGSVRGDDDEADVKSQDSSRVFYMTLVLPRNSTLKSVSSDPYMTPMVGDVEEPQTTII